MAVAEGGQAVVYGLAGAVILALHGVDFYRDAYPLAYEVRSLFSRQI